MSFSTKTEELLEKYNEIWNKVSNTIKERLDSEPVQNEKYLKTKIKSYEKKKSTRIFMAMKYQKEVPQCICILVILIDSVFRIGKNYYL